MKPDILSLDLIYSDPNAVVPLAASDSSSCISSRAIRSAGVPFRGAPLHSSVGRAEEWPRCCWCVVRCVVFCCRPYLATINFHYRSTLSHLDDDNRPFPFYKTSSPSPSSVACCDFCSANFSALHSQRVCTESSQTEGICFPSHPIFYYALRLLLHVAVYPARSRYFVGR